MMGIAILPTTNADALRDSCRELHVLAGLQQPPDSQSMEVLDGIYTCTSDSTSSRASRSPAPAPSVILGEAAFRNFANTTLLGQPFVQKVSALAHIEDLDAPASYDFVMTTAVASLPMAQQSQEHPQPSNGEDSNKYILPLHDFRSARLLTTLQLQTQSVDLDGLYSRVGPQLQASAAAAARARSALSTTGTTTPSAPTCASAKASRASRHLRSTWRPSSPRWRPATRP